MTRNPDVPARPVYEAAPGALTLEQMTVVHAEANRRQVSVAQQLADWGIGRTPDVPVRAPAPRPDPTAYWDDLRIPDEDRPLAPRTAQDDREARPPTQAQLRAQRRAWREERDLPPARKDRPSQTYEGRRNRLLRAAVAAGKFPDIKTADRLTPRRGR